MSRIYTTQDYFLIELTYNTTLVGTVANVKIKWQAPDDTTGEWNAVHDSVNKKISYQSPVGEALLVPGRWSVWNYVTFSDGRVLPGRKFKFLVKEEIE